MKNGVLIVGDSRRMKGGVSTVIKTMETSYLWDKYGCRWLECQINASVVMKVLYLLRGMFLALFLVPQYKIIHFHTTPGNSIRVQLLIFLYARLWRRRIILHLHVGNQLQNSADDKVFAWCCRRADAIITLGNVWKQYIPIDDMSRIHVIYNPAPPVSNPKTPEKYFLFAAYLDIVYKAYDTLIKGWAIVTRTHPDWKLVICGAGEVDNLMRYVREEGVEDSIDFRGWIDGEYKQQVFAHAYGYIMTSVLEGLPMSILESLARGVPVITTPVGNLPELLVNEQNALIFDFNDAQGMADCVNRLIEDNSLRQALVAEGQQLVQKKLTEQSFARGVDELYKLLLK